MRIAEDEEELKKQMDAVAKRLAKIAFVLIIGVILAQFMLQNDAIRHWVTDVERWEGAAYR
ncbi:hypothetical protein SAMN05216378_4853 [Paenibacillus catalpae]|uniref:Uncharacterized protein n=1 Tax=Paenibacillus catalpae TaxID=1045775 RepID=A0A1I2FHI4_9BACL|nr:hypothetical protein [Paenibacillus catalpae]SFF04339.1 hypothetical protein SAMN05216378_4853 [Paenibacillus catalpae]